MRRAGLIMALALFGCGEGEAATDVTEPTEPTGEVAEPETPATVAATADPAPSPASDAEEPAEAEAEPEADSEVPVAEDFSRASANEVTLQNYEAELDRIEAELRAEGVDVGAPGH